MVKKPYKVFRNGILIRRFSTFEQAKIFAETQFKHSSDDVSIKKDKDTGTFTVDRPKWNRKLMGVDF